MTVQTLDPRILLARYADGPAQLEAAVAGLTGAELDVARRPDTWTVRQIVHHVVDSDALWETCIKAALRNSQDVFSLQWYWNIPQAKWIEIWDYASRPIEPSLARFRANRCHTAQLLRRIPGAWERSILVKWPHRPEEPVTIGDVVETQANHAMGHIKEIRRIRQTHGLGYT